MRSTTGLCIAVLVCSLAVIAQKAPESRLVAQGEYSGLLEGKESSAAKALDHWLMYRQPDGTFKVDIEIKTVPAPDEAKEHLTYTKNMRLTRFEWVMRREGKSEPASIRCDFTDSESRCAGTTIGDLPFSSRLAIKAPYALLLVTDEAIFDFPWSFQWMVWQVKRSVNRSTSIDAVFFADGDTESGTVLRTGPHRPPALFRYLGRDTIDIVSQKVNAHKFETKGVEPDDGVVDYWFSDSGLLLKMTTPNTDPSYTIVLSRYQGPPL